MSNPNKKRSSYCGTAFFPFGYRGIVHANLENSYLDGDIVFGIVGVSLVHRDPVSFDETSIADRYDYFIKCSDKYTVADFKETFKLPVIDFDDFGRTAELCVQYVEHAAHDVWYIGGNKKFGKVGTFGGADGSKCRNTLPKARRYPRNQPMIPDTVRRRSGKDQSRQTQKHLKSEREYVDNAVDVVLITSLLEDRFEKQLEAINDLYNDMGDSFDDVIQRCDYIGKVVDRMSKEHTKNETKLLEYAKANQESYIKFDELMKRVAASSKSQQTEPKQPEQPENEETNVEETKVDDAETKVNDAER